MRLAISVATYFPEKNGVQFVTQKLAEGLVENGHDVTVLTRILEGCENESNIHGVHVLRCDIKNRHMFHFGNKKEFHRMLLEISQTVDAIIFVCLESVAADWALDILDKIKCGKILYMHGMHRFQWTKFDFQSIKNFVYKILRDIRWGFFYKSNRKKIGLFDKVIHLHNEDNAYLYFEKFFYGKNYVVDNFVDDMFFNKVDNISEERGYFICISNYHSGKNQLLLLKAFYLMNHKFKLIFIGSSANSYYKELVQLKLKLDKKYKVKKDIQFLYSIDRSEFPSLLQNSYAFILTSKCEVYPITILEAIASGVPYISTDVGIVKHIPGGIIVSDKAKDVANAMDLILEDKKQYYKLKHQAREYAITHCTLEKYLEKISGILNIRKENS